MADISQVDQLALEVITGGATTPRVDQLALEVVTGGVTSPQIDQLCLEVILRLDQTAAQADPGVALAVANLAGVKVGALSANATASAQGANLVIGALPADASAHAQLAGLMVGALGANASASANLGGVGIQGLGASALASAQLAGLGVGALPADATAHANDATTVTSLSFTPESLIEVNGELVLDEPSGELVLVEGPSELQLIGDRPVRYEMIRGSAVRPPFAVTLRDYAQSPINLTEANAAKLVLVRKHESETASKEVDLAFTSDKTTGVVYMPSWAYADTSTLAAGNYFGQIWVYWDGVDEPSKHGDITFVVKASALSGS